MTVLQQLKTMLETKYVTEDGDEYEVGLLPGMNEQKIVDFTNRLPEKRLPEDISALLRFARGFRFSPLDEVTFDGLDMFGLERLFPCSVQLAGDGFGNFWILDIDNQGNWGPVFYVCHDPAVVVMHSASLAEFISHVDEFGKVLSTSHLDKVHEGIVNEIWGTGQNLIDYAAAVQSADSVLKEFATRAGQDYMIADLRAAVNGAGFSWGQFGANVDSAIRHESEYLWAIKMPEKRKGWLSRLLNR